MTITETEIDMTITQPEPSELYQLTGVSKFFKQKDRRITALDNVDLVINQGDFITIQGPTGGGKSTLLQMLGALDRPDAGSVLLDGLDLATASKLKLSRARANEIGFVFQGFNLIPTLTAEENVNMALEPLKLSSALREERVKAALTQVGLADRADHLPGELSGGQQQRVAIARAIVKQPRVLLADEPTGNLDEAMRDEILLLLEELNVSGLTLVMVTHDSAVAKRAHRRLRLQSGRVKELTK